jgi:HK97 family phage major capsid protein
MKNLDLMQKEKGAILAKINQAVKDGNEEAFGTAFTEFTDMLQEAVMAEARGMVQAADNTVLVGRGVRALTSTETKYYNGLADAMRSKNPKQSLTGFDDVLPKTVVDAVFEDISEAHPLLGAINFQNTGALIEIIISTQGGRHLATWDKLCSTIDEQLAGAFDIIDLTQKKLSAYIPVCKAMLDVGPEWLDRYVRTILAEAIANGLEDGIIDGNGLDEPTGMRRNPNGALDQDAGYPVLQAIPLDEITPATYGAIVSALATGRNGLTRPVTEVIFLVNPVDYFTLLIPAVTVRAADGTYVERFPFPTRVIQSAYVPQGEGIIGLAKQYFFGLGTGKGGVIEYSDHYRFIEDERVYLTKLYGNGRPVDGNSFKRVDISGLKPTYPIFRGTPYLDARLASLTVNAGVAAIDPAFNGDTHYYEADVAAASGAIAAVAADAVNATVTMTLNGSAVDNPASITFAEGQNVVVITVTNGTEVETYVLVVTYTAG